MMLGPSLTPSGAAFFQRIVVVIGASDYPCHPNEVR